MKNVTGLNVVNLSKYPSLVTFKIRNTISNLDDTDTNQIIFNNNSLINVLKIDGSLLTKISNFNSSKISSAQFRNSPFLK